MDPLRSPAPLKRREAALVFCPLWAHVAPPALAYLAASAAPHRPRLFDFNHEFYRCHLPNPDETWWAEAPQFQPFMGLRPDWLRFELSLKLWEGEWAELLADWVERLSPFEIVGLSTNQTNLLASTALARALRRDRARTILAGGPSVNMDGRVFANHLLADGTLDLVVLGTGEEKIGPLLDRLVAGREVEGLPGILKREGGGREEGKEDKKEEEMGKEGAPGRSPLLSHPPDFSQLPMDEYFRPRRHWYPVYAVTGCVGRCRFCTIHEFHPRWRVKTVEAIVSELESLESRFGARTFFFADGMFLGRRETARALFDEAIRRGWRLALQIRLMAYWDDEELVKAASACVDFLELGLDGGSERVRRAMGKLADEAMTRRIFERFYRHGLPLYVNLIVGYPNEREEDFRRSEVFLKGYLKAYLEKNRILGLGTNPFFLPNGFPEEDFGISRDEEGHWQSPHVNRRIRADRLERLCRLAEAEGVGRSFVYTLDHAEGFPLRPAPLPFPSTLPEHRAALLSLPRIEGQIESWQAFEDGCLVCEGWAGDFETAPPRGVLLMDEGVRVLAWGPCRTPRRDLAWRRGGHGAPTLGFRLRWNGAPPPGIHRYHFLVLDSEGRARGRLATELESRHGHMHLRRRRFRDWLFLPMGRSLRTLLSRSSALVPFPSPRLLARVLHGLSRLRKSWSRSPR